MQPFHEAIRSTYTFRFTLDFFENLESLLHKLLANVTNTPSPLHGSSKTHRFEGYRRTRSLHSGVENGTKKNGAPS